MENLFDFVFSNLWIFIILFGVFSSLLGGDKKKEQKKHRPELDLPTMRQEKHREVRQEVKPAEVERPLPKMKSSIQEEKPVVSEQFRYSQEQLARQAARIEEKVATIKKSQEVQQKSVKPLPSLQQKTNLVNGIVMAEILGPPRAKKPMHKMK